MIEIWTELARFKIKKTKVWTIKKMVGFLTLKYWKSTNKHIGKHISRPLIQ